MFVNSNCVKYPKCEIKVSKKQLSHFVTEELDEEMKSENVILENNPSKTRGNNLVWGILARIATFAPANAIHG